MSEAHVTGLDPTTPAVASPWGEATLGAIATLLGLAIFLWAQSIPLGERPTAVSPRIWPESLGIGIMLLAMWLIVSAWRRPTSDDEPMPVTRAGLLRVTGFVLTVLAFGVLWYYVHFLVSAAVLVAALTFIAGGRGWKPVIGFPIVISAVLYALFGLLLKVPL